MENVKCDWMLVNKVFPFRISVSAANIPFKKIRTNPHSINKAVQLKNRRVYNVVLRYQKSNRVTTDDSQSKKKKYSISQNERLSSDCHKIVSKIVC